MEQDKSRLVKALFEDTALYLTYDYNLRIRKETVDAFTGGMSFASVLDMPCGTGDMSVGLLSRAQNLTLVDISSNMLQLAGSKIPAEQRAKVELINGDFFDLSFEKQSFDLVICLGLLAHVNSPEQLLQKLSGLITPGGLLIIQNTNSSHFYSHLIRFYLGLRSVFKKQSYKLNKVKASLVETVLKEQGFELVRCYRYNQSFLGLSNLFSNDQKYTLTKNFFGDAKENRHVSWGSDYTYLFRKGR